MFRLISSPDQEFLALLLAEHLRASIQNDPFKKQTVIVQSDGMANWLKLRIADQLGICSHVDFVMPSNYLWQLYHQLLPEVPERSLFARERLAWLLLKLLKTHPFDHNWGALHQLLSGATSDADLLKLATQITDWFDNYLMYRPDWINEWDQGNFQALNDNPELQWQAKLWHLLVQSIPQDQRWHRANIAERFKQRVAQSDGLESVFLFGVNQLPPASLAQFVELSQVTDVTLFWQNLSSGYWGDMQNPKSRRHIQDQLEREEHGSELDDYHPLFAHWGQAGRGFIKMLVEADIYGAENSFEYRFEPTERHEAPTLLTHLQSEILENIDCRDDRPEFSDQSISFNLAHSRLREVQVLKDAILTEMKRDPELQPKDIVVLIPNLTTYAPLFHSVFDLTTDTHRLPITVSDRSELEELPLFRAVDAILNLGRSRATVSEVLDLLDISVVRSKFGIEQDQLEKIRHWVTEANVFWGWDDRHWEELEFQSNGQHHWEFAKQRLLTSVLMSSDASSYNGVIGDIDIAGTDIDLLSRFILFIDQCQCLFWKQQQVLTAAEWQIELSEHIASIIDSDHSDAEALSTVFKRINSFFEAVSDAKYDDAIGLDTLRVPLSETLLSTRNSQRFASGRINVCTFLPMRSIPFKMVCMIGMNDGEMPRVVQRQNLDIVQREPRLGDRRPASEDKFMFLEALMSAQSTLYLSWLGEDIEKSTVLEPSILIQELRQFIEQRYADGILNRITKRHPLHAFNPSYFAETPEDAISFNGRFSETTPALESFASDNGVDIELPTSIAIEELTQFVCAAPKTFLRHIGVMLEEAEYENNLDIEPFDVNALVSWSSLTEYTQAVINRESTDRIFDRIKHNGSIASGTSQARLLKELTTRTQALASFVSDIKPGSRLDKRISLSITRDEEPNNVSVTGSLPYYFDLGGQPVMLTITGGKLKPKHHLRALVELLIANASGLNATQLMLGFSGSAFKRSEIPAFEGNTAAIQLSALVNGYLANLRKPIPFDEEIFQQYLSSQEFDTSSLATRRIIDGDTHWRERASHFIASVDGLLTHGTGD